MKRSLVNVDARSQILPPRLAMSDGLSIRHSVQTLIPQRASVDADTYLPDSESEPKKNVAKAQKKSAHAEWVKGKCPPKRPHKMTKAEKAIGQFKNIDFTRRDSDPQLAVQTLEFPDANIPRTDIEKRNECGQREKKQVKPKKGAPVYLSSSSSRFRDGVFTVKMREQPCSSASVLGEDLLSAQSKDGSILTGGPNSREMTDSQHQPSGGPKNLKGARWQPPCDASQNVGAPPRYIGRCPKNFQQLNKLAPVRQKFFLTQDPRKTHCLVNPGALRHKKLSREQENKLIGKMVKHGDNVCASSRSESSETFVCEVIDLENPVNLDFQGMDYKNTYAKDEQENQNQQTYWRVVRYMDRRQTKKMTEMKVEQELQADRLAVPAVFNTTIKDVPHVQPPPQKPFKLAELFRSPDKAANKQKIADEVKRREVRYKDIYLRNKKRMAERAQAQKEQDLAAKDVMARTVAERDLQEDVAKIDDDIERSFRKFEYIPPVIRKRKFFPNTLTETERLKRIMHKENCVRRDLARVTQEFYLNRTGRLKKYPDAAQQLRCEDSIDGSVGSTPSEKSSDDEDYLKVGKIGDKFQLRGFHFKHGDGLRGKLHRHQIMEGQRTVKGCLTRDEWLNQLAPRKEPIKLDVERGIIKLIDPDDPALDLFPPQGMMHTKKEHTSAIKEFIGKRLGMHYHRVLRKNLRLVKPRLQYNVRKFNLIRYVFPEKIIVPEATNLQDDAMDAMADQADTTPEYLALKQRVAKAKHLKQKLARMKLLGLRCVEARQLRELSPCEIKEEVRDQDWVPPVEQLDAEEIFQEEREDDSDRIEGGFDGDGAAMNEGNSIMKSQVATQSINTVGGFPTLDQRGNMPAPLTREKTLLIHPRRQRDYAAERVPSAQFNEAILNSGMPMLEKIQHDSIKFANVRTPKRPYTERLEARHHHDHWDPTQVKEVHVHYHTKTVYPEITVQEQPEKVPIVNFIKANPPCKQYLDEDLTLPSYDFQQMIKDHMAATRTDDKDAAREVVQDLCHPYDFIFHSRNPEELTTLDFPGRKQYLEFLRETREAIYEKKDIEPGEERLLVDRKAIEAELEEDLKSIEGCLTSLSSSECTNLSKDSGSFMLLEDEMKIPLEYIRKPLVPFEEMRRSRFQAEVIDVEAEAANPYRTLPFSGQLREQMVMLGPKDSFFTFSSRLRNGLRMRLEVPVTDVKTTLIGPGNNKYYGSVITDLDENYIDELKNRATVKSFNFKTGMELLKVAMRLKYESLLIQGKMVRTKIYDTLNEKHWQDMRNTQLLYEGLFAKWEKKEYNATMTQMYQVKTYYEITDKLKQEYRELEREQIRLNMDIVFTEGHWIHCVMLQNFHYLIGDEEWRAEHDWIHLVPVKKKQVDAEKNIPGEEDENVQYVLEPYDESIAKRSIVNIRVRDKDDAWAIHDFYYDVYMKNIHPVLQVFPDAHTFLKGIDHLKNKTFMLLLEMHYTLSVHTELQSKKEAFVDWCNNDLKEKQEYVARKSAKKYFMEDRAIEMEKRAHFFLDKPVADSFADEEFNKHRGILAEVWRRMIPTSVRGSSDAIPNASDMVAAISNVVLEVLNKFEFLDPEKVREVEQELRKTRRYQEKLSYQAYQVERRIDSEMKKVRHNLQPPYKKPKKTGPLQRLYLKKRVPKVIPPPVVISENARNFMRAFTEDGVVIEGFTHDAGAESAQDQIVPFYFDHFLKLNGYTPNYNFKTNIEMRDGPEINRFQIREIIPEVLQKVDNWENTNRKIMEDNIQRNPKMYENVN